MESDGQHFVHHVPMGIPTARPVDYYPSWGDIMEAMAGRDKAREREEAARKRAKHAGADVDALRSLQHITRCA